MKVSADIGFGKFTVPAFCVNDVRWESRVMYQTAAGSVNFRSIVPPAIDDAPFQTPAISVLIAPPLWLTRSPLSRVAAVLNWSAALPLFLAVTLLFNMPFA